MSTDVDSPRWPAPAAPEVSVVIVSWNGGEVLLDCLRSLASNPPDVAWEAIVVDNGSTDGTPARIAAELPWVRVIANPHNRGLAAANNQGVTASQAPFVLISNPDVIYTPGAIDALLDVLRRRDRAAFAIAKLTNADGTVQTSVGDLPTTREALLGRRLGLHRHGERCSGTWWHGWAHDQERAVGHGAEACYLVRRSAVAEIGLQDERFTLDWEGIDWSARARDAGWEIWFTPAAAVTHLGGSSVRQVPGRWVAQTHRGMYLFLRERTRRGLRPLLASLIAARAVAKLAALKLDANAYERAQGQTR